MSEPLAYFLTFTTYGTRLSGDDRCSVDRNHNTFGTRRIAPDQSYVGYARKLQKHESVVFSQDQRSAVDAAIRERCMFAQWELHALNVRTNHVHVVVTAPMAPELVMNSFKTWATRRLRHQALLAADAKIWARHGSTRYVRDEAGLAAVCEYTLERQ